MIRVTPVLALAFLPALAWAQESTDSTQSMQGMGSMAAMADEAMQPFMAVMDTMMQNMPTESSGDVDADFLRMMIPHHQSAIDMARIELEQGDDEEAKAMAQKIIDAQEQEIEEIRAMLERMGVEAPAAASE